MEIVETCGTTFKLSAIRSRQAAGQPLTFGELTALKIAQDSARAPVAGTSLPVEHTPVSGHLLSLKAAGRGLHLLVSDTAQTVR